VFFDDAQSHVGIANTISIVFSSPITTADLGTAPFNPFLIINQRRGKEVHLPGKTLTELGVPTSFGIDNGTGGDATAGDFMGPDSFPWAINVPGEFTPTMEGILITAGYEHFDEWAISGGLDFPDWYSDPDFIDPDMLLQ
jgi:LruC domain-containing protein